MVFSGIPFLFYFLPLLLAVYYAVPASYRAGRNLVLVAASLLFYAWGEGPYVLILLASIAFNHLFARALRKPNMGVLALGIVANLALLSWFKYSGFVADILHLQNWQILGLPLGISFFTFQAISYLVDVYRKEAPAADSILTSALYISSFPQLVAGPIVRYKTVALQIVARKESVSLFAQGVSSFIIGLAQKVLLANVLAEVADAAFNVPAAGLSAVSAWTGLLAYGLQIYFDFAGYSNMAIGLGLMLGFRFPMNFNTPYAAQSVTLFWRRWHMTLSEWFRDYLYIGLGGNRVGTVRNIINLWLVFLLCGLWHGAAWTFVAWGAWHGFFLSLERLGLSTLLEKIWQPFRHAYLLLTIFLGWVLFRADDLPHALDYYRALFGSNTDATPATQLIVSNQLFGFILLAFFLSIGVLNKLAKDFEIASMHASLKVTIASGYWLLVLGGFILSAASLAGGAYNPFIYFRF